MSSEKTTLKESVSALSELIEELGQKASERVMRFGLEAPPVPEGTSAGWRICVEVSDTLDAYGVIRLMEVREDELFSEDENRWFSEGLYKGVPVRVEWETPLGNVAEQSGDKEWKRWFQPSGRYQCVPMRIQEEKPVDAEGKPDDRREVSRARSALEEIQKDLMNASASICRGLGACSLALQEVEQ